jgi:hypothetical protein
MTTSSGNSTPPKGLTIHTVPRVAAASCAAVAAAGLRYNNVYLTTLGVLGVAAAAAGSYATDRLFPRTTLYRYADFYYRERNSRRRDHHHDATDAHILAQQRYNVGMRIVPGEHGKRPLMTVFYPTDVAPCDSERPYFIPYRDMRYCKGFTDYANAPAIGARHQVDFVMHMTQNATLANDLTAGADDTVGSTQHPIVIMSHGLAGHQHMYAAFATDLAASGAIVLSLQHCDGSACFALEPPADKPTTTNWSDMVSIAYRRPPPSETPEETRFREDQIVTRRVPEVRHVLSYIASGMLHTALHCPPAAIRKATTAKQQVVLVGHSFGATTVLAASALHCMPSNPQNARSHWTQDELSHLRERVHITATVVLDCWMRPVNSWLPESLRQLKPGEGASLPKLLALGSLHWERWTSNADEERALLAAWREAGGVAERRVKEGTDHMTLSVISHLVNLRRMRRKYAVITRDRAFTAEWASEALDFARASPPGKLS